MLGCVLMGLAAAGCSRTFEHPPLPPGAWGVVPLPWQEDEIEPEPLPFEIVDLFETYREIRVDSASRPELVERFASTLAPHREVLESSMGEAYYDPSRCVEELEQNYETVWRAHRTAMMEIQLGWQRTRAAFPDLEFDGATYLVPGCMHNQGVAAVDAEVIVIALESVASSHRGSVAATFQHEVLHHHHSHLAPEVFEGIPELYEIVWREGLAVYAAHAIDPTAPRWWHESPPLGMLAAARRVREDIDSSRPARLHAAYELDEALGTAPAYAVGAMLAEQAALERPLEELFYLRDDELLALMRSTLDSMAADLTVQSVPLSHL